MNTLQTFLRLQPLLINIFFNVTTFELLNIKSKILLKMYLNEKAGAFDRKKKDSQLPSFTSLLPNLIYPIIPLMIVMELFPSECKQA